LNAGKGRSGNEDGPIHDLPDFEFVDGRHLPETLKQRKWKAKRVTEKNRINEVFTSMEKDIQDGNLKQFW